MKKHLLLFLAFCIVISGNAQTTTFTYTGTIQTYTVPAGVTSIIITSYGAQGGGESYVGATGGLGAIIGGTFAVTPGQVLKILVGGQGTTSLYVGGGGGGSFVWDNATSTLLQAAGGGGGAGVDWDFIVPINGNNGTTTILGTNGDVGASMTAGRGTAGNGGTSSGAYYTWAGGGCGWNTNGNNGTGFGCTYSCTGGKRPLVGGAGGIGGGDPGYNANGGFGGGGGGNARCFAVGGGGGGGYSGGGAGGETTIDYLFYNYFPSGGGGGSYNGGTTPTVSVGNSGNGTVIINIACTPPSPITGTAAFCTGNSITLSDITPGGTWTSSATGIATVGATTGIVTGVGTLGGTAIISYTTSAGCYATTIVTVNPLPAAISGATSVCVGNTTVLTDLSGAGTWTSSSPGNATIGATTGVVAGVSSGTTTIVFTQTSTGCTISMPLTVNPTPSPITGTQVLCQGTVVTLSDATAGGTWSSSASGIASVGATTGIVSGVGVSGGTATITYTLATGGCYATALVTVNPLPATITGSSTICLGNSTTLTETTGGGTWSSSNPGIAPVVPSTGVVTGAAIGTATISYTITSTGCYTTFNETVNALPSAITGPGVVCVNATINLTDASGGGTWSSSSPSIATINASGLVTGIAAGTDTITYTLGTGCLATRIITVNSLPAAISGPAAVCVGSTITVTDPTGGGTWGVSGPQATITSAGVVTGVSAGFPNLTYTLSSTGCYITDPITVNPLPSTIAGVSTICYLTSSTFLNITSGGTWSSSNTSIVTIGATTGIATGIAIGIDTLFYTITATGCKTSTALTVQPPPTAITGNANVCTGASTTFADSVTGGIWTSVSTGTATIDSFSGAILGIASGTSIISYTMGACTVTSLVTVNPLPSSIVGITALCTNGATATLTDPTPGGTWSSSAPGIAAIGSTTGILTTVSNGTTIISYTLPTGCFATGNETINPLPLPITGIDTVCSGYTTTLSDGSLGGGLFSSAIPGIASVNASTGVVTGNAAGTTTITFTLTSTGCQVTIPYTVNPILSVAVGISSSNGDTICAGNMDTYTASAVNPGIAPIYHWTVNGSPMGGISNNFTYAPVNGDAIKCVLVSDALCAIPNTATSNTITMVVNPVSNPTVSMSSTKGDTLCVGTSNTYNVSSTSGGTSPTYLWTINWMPVATGVTTYSFTPNNGDIIRCGMVSSSPCPVPDTAFAVDTVVVKNYDTPKVVIINMNGGAVCQGNMINLAVNSENEGWGPTYFWSVNGVGIASNNSMSYLPSDSDIVICTMISNYHCPAPNDTAIATIQLKVDPVIQVNITGNPGSLVQVGYWDTLTANIINGGDDPTYQWYVNGVPISGAIYPTLIRNDLSELDSVSCVVTTGSGSACEGVKGFNWMIVQVAKVSVNIIVISIGDIKLLPNPNNGTFRLAGTINGSADGANILITDVVGREVYHQSIALKGTTLDHEINMENILPEGIYMLQLMAGNDKKIIRFTINK